MKGAPAGKVRLIGVYGNSNELMDSSEADANGKVVFKQDTTYDTGFYYIVYTDNTAFYALLDKDQEFTLSSSKENWIDDAKVTGSLDNQLYYENLKYEKAWRPKLDSVTKQQSLTKAGTPEYEKWEKEKKELEAEKEKHLRLKFCEE